MIQRHIIMELGQLCCIITRTHYRSLQFTSVNTNLLFMWIKQNQNQINPGEGMDIFVGQWVWVQLIGWIENRAAPLFGVNVSYQDYWHKWECDTRDRKAISDSLWWQTLTIWMSIAIIVLWTQYANCSRIWGVWAP